MVTESVPQAAHIAHRCLVSAALGASLLRENSDHRSLSLLQHALRWPWDSLEHRRNILSLRRLRNVLGWLWNVQGRWRNIARMGWGVAGLFDRFILLLT